MVDIFSFFKLEKQAYQLVKASKGAYTFLGLAKELKKPLIFMGIAGMADAAAEDAMEMITKELKEKE